MSRVNRRKQAAFPFLPHLDVSGLADRILVEAMRLARIDDMSEPRLRAALLLAAARSGHSVDQSSSGWLRDACGAWDLGRAIGFAELAHRDTLARDRAAARLQSEAMAEARGETPTQPSPGVSLDPEQSYQGSAGSADMAENCDPDPP